MARIYRSYVRTLAAIQRRTGSAPDAGFTTVEWGLIVGGVAVVAITAVAIFGEKVFALFNTIPGG